jgi:hypothetical protein
MTAPLVTAEELAPQSIPTPLVRCLVAWFAPSAVLRASAGIVGRRASLNSHPTLNRDAASANSGLA